MHSLDNEITQALEALLRQVYQPRRAFPDAVPEPLPVPEEGLGMGALASLWDTVARGATHLGGTGMMGHMDTVTHPAAALTDAVVSALDNNPLFRELAPFASAVEELLIADCAQRIGFPPEAAGVFTSGGSIANLTALFAACGGYADPEARPGVRIFCTAAVHNSITRAAAVLGLGKKQIVLVAHDRQGRMDVDALRDALRAHPSERPIVVAICGNTLFGALDDLPAIAREARAVGAWLHVDAVYGGALAFSAAAKRRLQGLGEADSVIFGPQKWLYVPRLSAMALFRDRRIFDRVLKNTMPYSAMGEEHRGAWGLQGSRRADAVTLWVTLQVVGTRQMGAWIDATLEAAQELNRMLHRANRLRPVHQPDLSIQVFQRTDFIGREKALEALHASVTQTNTHEVAPWFSLSRSWDGTLYLRAVILNPETGEDDFRQLIELASA
ncbi:MAG: aminotransferase class V-fold PLP-dependent enzyme [Pseudomonadota bacterium]